MTNRLSHAQPAWLMHVVPAVFVVALFILLWRPDPAQATRDLNEERVSDLATLLGTPNPNPTDIEERLLRIARFPPAGAAARQLAEALSACSMAAVAEPQRTALVRHVYAITSGGELPTPRLALALNEIQQIAIGARCSPVSVAALVDAARLAARRDPSPRRDWW